MYLNKNSNDIQLAFFHFPSASFVRSLYRRGQGDSCIIWIQAEHILYICEDLLCMRSRSTKLIVAAYTVCNNTASCCDTSQLWILKKDRNLGMEKTCGICSIPWQKSGCCYLMQNIGHGVKVLFNYTGTSLMDTHKARNKGSFKKKSNYSYINCT